MKAPKPERRADLDPGAFASALSGPVAEAMERQATLVGATMRLFQEEGINFMRRRFEANTKAAQDLTACKSIPELVAAQQQWFANMTRAYSEEWMRCNELVSSSLQSQADEEEGHPRRKR